MIDLSLFVRPGSGVWWGQGGAEPEPLVDALLDQVAGIGPVRAFSGLTWNRRLGTDVPEELQVVSYGGLGELRRLSRAGRLEVVPCHYSALPGLFARGQLPSDVGLLQVSPPDDDGMVSLGIGVEYVADAVDHTPVLVAEVNQRMPRTIGAPTLPLDRFAAVVHTDRPLRESVPRPPDEVDRAIASHVASLVDDGATLQMGVGSLPNAVLQALAGHADLGFHSGMITDGVAELIDKGVITGARKEVEKGVVVTGAALGTEWLYHRLPELPVHFRAASHTHHPAVLSQLRTLTAINSALEVDLSGQVNAEVVGATYVGAIGGQVDFCRAASLTGARSIIALRSEVAGRSTLVRRLRGSVVTTSRADVDVVVTEHGAAVLTGLSLQQRARRLIAVAAPQHREALERCLVEEETP